MGEGADTVGAGGSSSSSSSSSEDSSPVPLVWRLVLPSFVSCRLTSSCVMEDDRQGQTKGGGAEAAAVAEGEW